MNETSELREYSLSHNVLNDIPKKIYHPFSSVNVEVTCFDASHTHLLFGTNAGCAFLCNRENGHVIKLVCQDKHDHVSTVKLLVGLECQMALGCTNGKIMIIIFSLTAVGTKQVRKFPMGKIHNNEVCCMEWSSNGMKLFTGDRGGDVYCIDVDFDDNKCSSSSLLTEGCEIVQMEYRHKILLVSTVERSILFSDGNETVIGSKPTRNGTYGACYNTNTVIESELKVFATRPGMRIWISNSDGHVTSTLKMKGVAQNSSSIIELQDLQESESEKDFIFGPIKRFSSSCLVTYHGSTLYVIDYDKNNIVGELHNLVNLIDVQVTNDEIFILCAARKLIRIAYTQDDWMPGSNNQERKDGIRLQEMKESLSGMRINFSSITDSIQSKVAGFNVEQVTSKIQAQAKDLKKKVTSLPVAEITEHFLFTKQNAETETPQSDASMSKLGEANQLVDNCDLIVKKLLFDLIADIEQAEDGASKKDYLRSQGIHPNTPQETEKSYKVFRFENINVKSADEDIVFSSKIKKKRKNKSSGRISNSSLESEEGNPISTCLSESKEGNITWDRMLIRDLHSTKVTGTSHKTMQLPSDDITHSTNNPTVEVNIIARSDEPIHQSHLNMNVSGLYGQELPTKNNDEIDDENDNHYDVVDESVNVNLSHNDNSLHSNVTTVTQSVDILDHVMKIETNSQTEFMTNLSQEDSTTINTVNENLNLQSVEQSSGSPDIASSINNASLEDRTVNHDNSLVSCIVCNNSPLESREKYEEEMPQSPDVDIYAVDAGGDFSSEDECSVESNDISSPEPTNDYRDTSIDGDVKDEEYFTILKMRPELYGTSGTSLKSADAWMVHNVPTNNIALLSGSEGIVCFITNKDRIYCMEEMSDQVNFTWHKIVKKAMHIALSPSGDFVWIITRKGNVYASSVPVSLTEDPSHSTEIHFNWNLVYSKGSHICLGVGESWFVGTDGQVVRQRELSRSKPSNKSYKCPVDIRFVNNKIITATIKISQISLTNDVVWMLTTSSSLLAKPLASIDEHSNWNEVECPRIDDAAHKLKTITSDYRSTMWAIDEHSNLWYRSKVTKDKPAGQEWWQVHLNEYVYVDKRKPLHQMTAWMYGSTSINTIAISLRAVWVASDNNKLHMTRGPVTGNAWKPASISGVATSTRWSHVTSSSLFSPDSGTWEGLVWVTRMKGEIICFSSHSETHRAVALAPPVFNDSPVACLSASREALWMLLESGDVYVRSGISSTSPTGTNWDHVDVSSQLGNVKLVNISCGSLCVWGVDEIGRVYVRMGVTVSKDHETMTPAWLPIDGCPVAGSKFIQIACGPSDINVWALDNQGNPHVREGVTAELPVGESWRMAQGSQVEQVVISNHTVWALCSDGSILRRYGITHSDCVGDYWTKMPGSFTKLAVTPYDELWAIDSQQHLRGHVTNLYYPPLLEAMYDDDDSSSSTNNENVEKKISTDPDEVWEML